MARAVLPVVAVAVVAVLAVVIKKSNDLYGCIIMDMKFPSVRSLRPYAHIIKQNPSFLNMFLSLRLIF
jgi:hypothetical protein